MRTKKKAKIHKNKIRLRKAALPHAGRTRATGVGLTW
jgi:hypothetical protein